MKLNKSYKRYNIFGPDQTKFDNALESFTFQGLSSNLLKLVASFLGNDMLHKSSKSLSYVRELLKREQYSFLPSINKTYDAIFKRNKYDYRRFWKRDIEKLLYITFGLEIIPTSSSLQLLPWLDMIGYNLNEHLRFKTKRELRLAIELWVKDKYICYSMYGDIGQWDVSGISDMSHLFENMITFNDDISKWDVSNVTNMRCMFCGATAFNRPLNGNGWNVSNVTNMSYMFRNAMAFNQQLKQWDVSNVTEMYGMFCGATVFNQPLNDWNVSKVTDIHSMFCEAITFNQSLDQWDVSNVTNMHGMFYEASSFNKPLGEWNVSRVKWFQYMFDGASAFNQQLNQWNVSNAISMHCMFQRAHAFNQPF